MILIFLAMGAMLLIPGAILAVMASGNDRRGQGGRASLNYEQGRPG